MAGMLAREAVEDRFLERGRRMLDRGLVGACRVEGRRDAHELAVLGRAGRALGEVVADDLILGGLERVEHVAAEKGAALVAGGGHASTPISSSASRRPRRAYEVRLLTVPSGMPVRSEISRRVRPWKCASRMTWRCSGVSRSSADPTCQRSSVRSNESSVAPCSSAWGCAGSAGLAAWRRFKSMIAL